MISRNDRCSLSSALVSGMICGCRRSAAARVVVAYGAAIGTEAPGARRCGRADTYDEPRPRVSSWPPLRLTRLRRERGSVVVVWPADPVNLADGRGACDGRSERAHV